MADKYPPPVRPARRDNFVILAFFVALVLTERPATAREAFQLLLTGLGAWALGHMLVSDAGAAIAGFAAWLKKWKGS